MAQRTCVIDGCDRPHLARGWCGAHYQRWRTTGTTDLTAWTPSPCAVAGCSKRSARRGWCFMHYRRWRVTGDIGRVGEIKRRRALVIEGRKQCASCAEWVPLDGFRVSKRGTAGRSSICHECHVAYGAAWRRANPAYPAEWRARNQDKVQSVVQVRRALRAQRQSEPISPAVVFRRDEFTCRLCGEPLDMAARWPEPRSPSIDHITPLSRGGDHLYSNIQAAHFVCNVRKGNRVASPA